MPLPLPLPPGMRELPLGEHGLTAWAIDTPACSALVSAQGAQLLAFQPRGGAPLLWQSPTAVLQPGKAIRGGIPLCFPWFGPHPDTPALPAHGFARVRPWRLRAAETQGEDLHLALDLEADADTWRLWPFDFRAELQMTLGRTVRLALHVSNPRPSPLRFSFAFHSYFALQDCARARVEGLEGSVRLDQLDPTRRRTRQQGPLRFAGETDQVFLGVTGDLRLVDEAADTSVRIAAPGCRSAVAWNPGPEKAARLGDMPAAAWTGMACVETGNLEEDAVSLAPGETGRFGLLLSRP